MLFEQGHGYRTCRRYDGGLILVSNHNVSDTSCNVRIGDWLVRFKYTFSSVGLTAFAGTVTGTTTVVDSPAFNEITAPSWPSSCQPKSEPSSTTQESAAPIFETMKVNVVVALAQSHGRQALISR